jgi:Zn-dependent protease with chaperone function
MSERGVVSRQLIVRIFTSDSYFFALWSASTVATAGILLLAATITAETVTLLTVVYVSAVLCLAVSFGLGYALLVLTGCYGRLSRIVAEESSVTVALARIGTQVGALVAGLVWASLVVFGESLVAGVAAGGLFVSLLVVSRRVVESRMATRSLTAAEREQLSTAFDPDVRYRTITGAAGEVVNAQSAGLLASRSTIYLTERAFERLKSEQIEALAAHELAHVRGRHPAFVLAANSVPVVLSLGSIRLLLQSQWSLAVIALGGTLASALASAAMQRRFEGRADRSAADRLGDTQQMVDQLEAIQACRSTPSEPAAPSFRSLSPAEVPSHLRRLFETHPHVTHRIERLQSRACDGSATAAPE